MSDDDRNFDWNNQVCGGWQVRLGHVRRWYDRAFSAADPIDRGDYLSAFFESAFYLRDWLEDTGVVSTVALQAFFDANQEMRLCRDLGNAHKRYVLRRSGQPVLLLEVHELFRGSASLSDVSLMILSDGIKYDAFDLAKRVLLLWEAFMPSATSIVTALIPLAAPVSEGGMMGATA